MEMDIGKFLKSPEHDIKIITYRDIFQTEALELDRFGEDYRKLSACIIMSKIDMNKMGFKTGDRVRIINNYGSVVVKVIESKREEPGGLGFMPNSPWSNTLVSDVTGGNGIPDFKEITAKISLTKDEVMGIESLMPVSKI